MIAGLLSSVWGVVSLVGAAGGAALSLASYRRSRQVKRLAFAVTRVKIVEIDREARSSVTILLDGRVIRDLEVVNVGISNAGNRAITKSDFRGPLRVVFPHAGLVAAQFSVNNGAPEAAEISDSTVLIPPLLVNPRDTVSVDVLTEPGVGKPELFARVVGAAEPRDSTQAVSPRKRPQPNGVAWIAVGGVLLAGVVAVNVAVLRLNIQLDRLNQSSQISNGPRMVVLKNGTRLCGTVVRNSGGYVVESKGRFIRATESSALSLTQVSSLPRCTP